MLSVWRKLISIVRIVKELLIVAVLAIVVWNLVHLPLTKAKGYGTHILDATLSDLGEAHSLIADARGSVTEANRNVLAERHMYQEQLPRIVDALVVNINKVGGAAESGKVTADNAATLETALTATANQLTSTIAENRAGIHQTVDNTAGATNEAKDTLVDVHNSVHEVVTQCSWIPRLFHLCSKPKETK